MQEVQIDSFGAFRTVFEGNIQQVKYALMCWLMSRLGGESEDAQYDLEMICQIVDADKVTFDGVVLTIELTRTAENDEPKSMRIIIDLNKVTKRSLEIVADIERRTNRDFYPDKEVKYVVL